MYGSMRELTDEELARAVHLDPSQIAGLGPSLDALLAMLEERKRKILATYETDKVQKTAGDAYRKTGQAIKPPGNLQQALRAGRSRRADSRPGAALVPGRRRPLAVRPPAGAARRAAGREVPGRRAGRQVRVHRPHAADACRRRWRSRKSWRRSTSCSSSWKKPPRRRRSASSTWKSCRSSPSRATSSKLNALQQQIEELLRQMAEQQGLERGPKGFQLTPKAYRLFQGKLLERIFSNLQAVAHRPASGPDRRRRGRRAAADEAVRVRRLGRQHGHPRLADQRHAPRRPGLAGPAEAGRHRHPPHAQHAQVRHRPC